MDVLETVLAKLDAGEYKSALEIVADPGNDEAIMRQTMEFISLISNNLTDDFAENKPDLYATTEALLNRLAQKCSPAEVLYELMEKIRSTTSDEVFTSLLKSLQVAILRLPLKRARCLEWVFSTIIEYLDKIEVPSVLSKDMDEKEEILLEGEESIRRMLQLYITLMLFLEPIAKHLNQPATIIYYDTSVTQKNVLVCFMLRLIGKLFPFLQLQRIEQPRNTLRRPHKLAVGKSYSIQVAEDMISMFVTLFQDPLFLLTYGEKRLKIIPHEQDHENEQFFGNDCFMNTSTYTSEGLALLFYMLLAENLLPASSPQIYDSRYIFEAGLYHVSVLLSNERTIVYFKGIRLAQGLVKLLQQLTLNSRDLDSPIHSSFCERFIRALERSASVRNREIGINVFTEYIHKFDDEGRYTIISHILKKFEDDSVRSYAINVYKDLVFKEIRHRAQKESLVRWYSGDILQDMLTNHVCILKQGAQTDLLDNSYSIISALSTLWVLLKTDQANRSQIWDFFATLEKEFLLELRTALDLSRAHYKNELKATVEGAHRTTTDQMPQIAINTINGEMPSVLSHQQKEELCQKMILRLDMLDFHWARVNSEIEHLKQSMSKSKSMQEMDVV